MLCACARLLALYCCALCYGPYPMPRPWLLGLGSEGLRYLGLRLSSFLPFPADSNSCITSNILFPSLTVLTYMDRSSPKAAWFHWGVLLMLCVIPVASSNRRSASKRRGERTEPCTVPVSSCMGAEHPVPTVIFIHDLLYSSSRKSTSGTPRPLRIAQRQECPAELKAFFEVQIYPGHSAAIFHCLLLYPMCPLDHHLYSSVCSEAKLGAFHDRLIFGELSESACDYQHKQLVYGVQECDGSVVIQYGCIFVLVKENNFRHQQFSVAFVDPN